MLNVDKLNLLKLAPGGHVGRFIIWTQSAFDRLGVYIFSLSVPLFILLRRELLHLYYKTWSKISLGLKLMLSPSFPKQIKVTASILTQG
jgi:hypothetical protein